MEKHLDLIGTLNKNHLSGIRVKDRLLFGLFFSPFLSLTASSIQRLGGRETKRSMASLQHISEGDKWGGLNQVCPGNATFQEFQEVFKLF